MHLRQLFACIIAVAALAGLTVAGPTVLGHALFALGFPVTSARLLADPGWSGYVLARNGDFARAAAAFGHGGEQAYNRGTALAHAGSYAEALGAYDQALDANPEDSDARFNRDVVRTIVDSEKAAPGDAKGSANARANVEGRHGSGGERDSDTPSVGVGFTGTKEGASTDASQGGSKVAKVGKGSETSRSAASETASGSAGQAAGRGRSGSDLADITAQMTASQRRVTRSFTAQSIRPNIDWLQSVADDPGAFLKIQINAERKRRAARVETPSE